MTRQKKPFLHQGKCNYENCNGIGCVVCEIPKPMTPPLLAPRIPKTYMLNNTITDAVKQQSSEKKQFNCQSPTYKDCELYSEDSDLYLSDEVTSINCQSSSYEECHLYSEDSDLYLSDEVTSINCQSSLYKDCQLYSEDSELYFSDKVRSINLKTASKTNKKIKYFQFICNDWKKICIEANLISKFSSYLRDVQSYTNFSYRKPIYLANINSKTLLKIKTWLLYHRDDDISELMADIHSNIDIDANASQLLEQLCSDRSDTESCCSQSSYGSQFTRNFQSISSSSDSIGSTTSNSSNISSTSKRSNTTKRSSTSISSSRSTNSTSNSSNYDSDIDYESISIDSSNASSPRGQGNMWDSKLFPINLKALVLLIMAANFLNIEPLMSHAVQYFDKIMTQSSTNEFNLMQSIHDTLNEVRRIEDTIPKIQEIGSNQLKMENQKKIPKRLSESKQKCLRRKFGNF